MRLLLLCYLISIITIAYSQKPTPEDYGYTQIPFQFEGENVDIILLSGGAKYGTIKKPLFLV